VLLAFNDDDDDDDDIFLHFALIVGVFAGHTD
jgi:hypothetical protein